MEFDSRVFGYPINFQAFCIRKWSILIAILLANQQADQ